MLDSMGNQTVEEVDDEIYANLMKTGIYEVSNKSTTSTTAKREITEGLVSDGVKSAVI